MSERLQKIISFGVLTLTLFVVSMGIGRIINEGWNRYHEVQIVDFFVVETGDYMYEKKLESPIQEYDVMPIYEINNTYPITYTLVSNKRQVYVSQDGKYYIMRNAFNDFFG